MIHMRRILLFVAAVFMLFSLALPLHAATTNVYLSSFQNVDWTKRLTGEIYYNNTGSASTFYSYCVDPATNMPIPGNYYAESLSISGNQSFLKAAWLMDNYAYSKFNTMSGFNANETGTIVQLAIYSVIGQPVTPPVSGYEALFTKRDELLGLLGLVPTTELSFLATKYKVLDIYNNSDKTVAFQDVITPIPPGATVPLPQAVWLLGSGLVGLVGLRKKIFG